MKIKERKKENRSCFDLGCKELGFAHFNWLRTYPSLNVHYVMMRVNQSECILQQIELQSNI